MVDGSGAIFPAVTCTHQSSLRGGDTIAQESKICRDGLVSSQASCRRSGSGKTDAGLRPARVRALAADVNIPCDVIAMKPYSRSTGLSSGSPASLHGAGTGGSSLPCRMTGSGCSSCRSSEQLDRRARSSLRPALGEALPMNLSSRSVDNPANSRLQRAAPGSNLASILRPAPWPRFCCFFTMNHDELRVRIRQLIASGELPSAPPLSDGSLSGQVAKIRRIVIGRSLPDPCLICGEADPTVSYAYANGKVVRIHAACDALWRQERETPS